MSRPAYLYGNRPLMPFPLAHRLHRFTRREGPSQLTMRTHSGDLYGDAPSNCHVALILIDVINDMEYPGGDDLLPQALPAGHAIAALKRRARDASIPVVYVNDNFGRWRADFKTQVRRCLEDGVRGKPFVALVLPDPQDYFVLKPKDSAFYATPLAVLLEYLGARTLILAGLTSDRCVLMTASDAYLRAYGLYVPTDCTAAMVPGHNRHALDYMARVFKATTTPSDRLDLDVMATGGDRRS